MQPCFARFSNFINLTLVPDDTTIQIMPPQQEKYTGFISERKAKVIRDIRFHELFDYICDYAAANDFPDVKREQHLRGVFAIRDDEVKVAEWLGYLIKHSGQFINETYHKDFVDEYFANKDAKVLSDMDERLSRIGGFLNLS